MTRTTQRAPSLRSLLAPILPLVGLMTVPVLVSWTHYPLAPGLRNAPHLYFAAGLLLLLLATASGALPTGLRHRPQMAVFLVAALAVAAEQRHFAPNELAGVLVALIPLPLALAVAPTEASTGASTGASTEVPMVGLPLARRVSVLLTLLLVGSLLHGQSRSGLGALALVMGPLLLALGGQGRRLLVVLVVVGLLLLPVVGIDNLLELMIYDQKIQRLDLFSFLTGRPHIWQRAVLALGDLGTVGAGLGAGGPLTAAVYPYSRLTPGDAFEDVHNLYLQTALDLGLPGAAAFFSLVGLALLRLWRRGRRGPVAERPWSLGLGAALVAHLLYSLFDSVALGTPGSLVTWLVLGLACSGPMGGPPRQAWLAPAVLPLALWAPWPALPSPAHNLAALDACRALTAAPTRAGAVRRRLLAVPDLPCRAHWLAGELAATLGDRLARDDDWDTLMACAPRFIELVEAEATGDLKLARRAVARQPTEAAAQRFLARALVSSLSPEDGTPPTGPLSPSVVTEQTTEQVVERAVARYRHALALDPTNGQAWLEVGELLYLEEPRAALDAWIEVCELGDFRGQGCLRAGALALRLDDLPTAVSFYRKSRMPGARQYGDFLAQGLEAGSAAVDDTAPTTPHPPGG